MVLSTIVLIISVLSALGSLSITFYLLFTESQAPIFFESIKNVKDPVKSTALLSIIITAKNEERLIGRCIESLASQTYGNLEIVVVDDSSADETMKVAENLAKTDSRIRVVSAGEKPPGWVGKSWPCQRGFENSKGEYLLFVDADSTFEPKTVELSLNYMRSMSFEMFSISPKVKLRGVWSNSTLPLLAGAINLLYPMVKVNDPSKERAYVFGTFILVARDAYVAIGGHENVKDKLVEDAAIAHLVKSSRRKLRVERGSDLIYTEWETDVRVIFHGLERVFSDSIRPWGLFALLNAVLLFFLGIFPIFVVVGYIYLEFVAGASYSLISFPTLALAASLLSIGTLVFTAGSELRLISGRIRAFPVLYPLGLVLFIVAIITASIRISRNGSFEWKGSKYSEQARTKS